MNSPQSTLDSTTPARHTERLFPQQTSEVHLQGEGQDEGELSDFAIGRILEEGEQADLEWLMHHTPEPRLRGWLTKRGARQLSRRSLLFWSLLLDLPETPARSEVQDAIWPL